MDFVTLGRTGLRASVVGLGAGGPSRLGQTTGSSEKESIDVVRRGLDLGVNFLDTAEAYGTEPTIGAAIQGVPRDSLILSTKNHLHREDRLLSAADFVRNVEASLQRLGTDYIDILHIHGLHVHQVDHALQEIVPALLDLKREGKIRFLGVSESFGSDTDHAMFKRVLEEQDVWDVAMVGFNILNQSARHTVFPRTMEKNIGTECMFTVRRALSNPEKLRTVVADLVAAGEVDAASVDLDNPLGFALEESDASTLAEVAYRFCRYEPGIDVVLTGTGNVHHLEENVQSLLKPPLPNAVVDRLKQIFARVTTVSGN